MHSAGDGTSSGGVAGWALAAVLVLASASLHLENWRSAGPLWRDEANFVTVATRPTWSELWEDLPTESFPLAPLALARFWADLGPGRTDAGLRLGGLFVGLGLLGALAWTAKLLKTGPPVLALALVGFSAVIVRWGDGLRGYGLGTLFVILAFGLTWMALETRRPRWWLAAGTATVLAAQCLYSNVVLVGAIAAAATAVSLRRGDRESLRRIALLLAVTAVTLLPYAGQVLAHRDWRLLTQERLTPSLVWQRMSEALSGPTTFMAWCWVALVVLALLVAGAAQFRARSSETARQQDRLLYSGITLACGTCGYLAFLVVVRYGSLDWHWVAPMTLAAAAVGAVLGVATRSRRVAARVLGLSGCVLAGLCWVGAWPALQVRQTDIDRLAAELAARATARDLVLVDPWFLGISFGRYYRGAAPWETIPPLEDKSVHRFDQLKRRMTEERPLDPLLQRALATLRAGGRVWVVGWPQLVHDGEHPAPLPPAPTGPAGWASGAYSLSWSRQVMAALQSSAARWAPIDPPGGPPVSRYEDAILLVFEARNPGP